MEKIKSEEQMKNNKTRKKTITIVLVLTAVALVLFFMPKKTNNLNSIEQISAKAEYTTKIGKEEFDISNLIEENPIPKLSAGMIPIKWDKEINNWKITTKNDDNWYDYSNGKPAYIMLNDGTYKSEVYYNMPSEKILAQNNIGLKLDEDELGSIYMWVPRFAYNSNQIVYLKEECTVIGNYRTPDMFKYSLSNDELSLSGAWVELKNDNSISANISNMNLGESDTKYRFLSNTKADAMTSEGRMALEYYIKWFKNDENIYQYPDVTSASHIEIKIIDIYKKEPINAYAEYNVSSAKINVTITKTINGIKKIIDEDGDELTFINQEQTQADTGNKLWGNGTYYFYVIDNNNNAIKISCKVTGSNIYRIKDRETLIEFRNAVNSGKTDIVAVQVKDVTDLNAGKYTTSSDGTVTFSSSAEEWTPIGTVDKPFTGKYNGNGYTIYGIYINGVTTTSSSGTNNNKGFFGGLAGSITGLNISGSRITGYDYIGGLIGQTTGNATIENCSFNGYVLRTSIFRRNNR